VTSVARSYEVICANVKGIVHAKMYLLNLILFQFKIIFVAIVCYFFFTLY